MPVIHVRFLFQEHGTHLIGDVVFNQRVQPAEVGVQFALIVVVYGQRFCIDVHTEEAYVPVQEFGGFAAFRGSNGSRSRIEISKFFLNVGFGVVP